MIKQRSSLWSKCIIPRYLCLTDW